MAIVPNSDEERRLGSLKRLNILDTALEARFDRITRLAQRIFNVSTCAICFTDENRRWIKSAKGLSASQVPRDNGSLCERVITDKIPLIVEDRSRDHRLNVTDIITCKPLIRFFAAHPIRDNEGLVIGTFCLMDISPRRFTTDDMTMLIDLTGMVESEVNANHSKSKRASASAETPAIDSVTGIFNHIAIRSVLKYKLARARKEDAKVAVIMADLDRFKDVNDKYGRLCCEEVMREVAVRIKSQIDPETSVVGRYGDDEFLIVLCDCDLHTALAKADAMRKAIGEKSFVVGVSDMCKDRLWGTVSLGVAATPGRCPSDADEDSLIRSASAALWKAKNNGRNRVEAMA